MAVTPTRSGSCKRKATSLLKSHKPPQPTLSREEREAVYSLKKRDDIVIIKADKSNTTVVLDRDEYDDKLITMLKDITTYVELKRDPTQKTKRVVNQFVSQLREEDKISPTTTHRLKSSYAGSPRLYGLPKIHKANIHSIRTDCFLYRVTNVRIVKRIGIHFIEISINKHHVKNSEEFVKSVTSIKIEETEILVSFDVISLFSKIPVDLAIKVAQKRLYKLQNLSELTKWSVNDICIGLQICLKATYLTFRKINFKQIFGIAMGSQVSVIVANLVMEDVETRAFETFAHPPLPDFGYATLMTHL